jgi:hypothetical protein
MGTSIIELYILFSKKEAKSVVLFRRRVRVFFYPNFGEADPGGLGVCPQKKPLIYCSQVLGRRLVLRGLFKKTS